MEVTDERHTATTVGYYLGFFCFIFLFYFFI